MKLQLFNSPVFFLYILVAVAYLQSYDVIFKSGIYFICILIYVNFPRPYHHWGPCNFQSSVYQGLYLPLEFRDQCVKLTAHINLEV